MSMILTVSAYAFAGLGLVGLVWALDQILLARETLDWPRAIGEVTRSWIETRPGSEGDKLFEGHVEYSYLVGICLPRKLKRGDDRLTEDSSERGERL